MVFTEKEVSISEIKDLLAQDYEVEIDSPDGYVPINYFVDKGEWDEYVIETMNGFSIRCNEGHLVKLVSGDWIAAKDLATHPVPIIMTEKGPSMARVEKTGNRIPIVDLNIDHENHRYYSAGIESHNTGVGKSMVMCHMAASNLIRGKNVLYITLEMAEERISERIDVNLLNLTFDELSMITKEQFIKRVEQVKSKTTGKLIVKEYATASAGVATFRALLNELKIKRNFVPDIIYIDYLNIAVSSRIKMGNAVNSYTYIKAIAEEFRGLAIEFNVPVISATQTNRSGAGNSDVELTDTSESYGLPMTVDFMFALITDEDLQKRGQIIVKQLKNRYEDLNKLRRFIIGVDKSRMKLYDVEASAQDNLMQDHTDDSYGNNKKPGGHKYDDDRFADLF